MQVILGACFHVQARTGWIHVPARLFAVGDAAWTPTLGELPALVPLLVNKGGSGACRCSSETLPHPRTPPLATWPHLRGGRGRPRDHVGERRK